MAPLRPAVRSRARARRRAVAVGPEQLDAVVVIGIVRGRDHHAEIGAHRARQHGHGGGRNRAGEQHIHADRGEPGHQAVLDHIAGKPRVLAESTRWRCSPRWNSNPAAWPTFRASSAVSVPLLALPRMPSVPKYFANHPPRPLEILDPAPSKAQWAAILRGACAGFGKSEHDDGAGRVRSRCSSQLAIAESAEQTRDGVRYKIPKGICMVHIQRPPPNGGVYEFFLTREHRTFRLTDSSGAKIVVFGTLGGLSSRILIADFCWPFPLSSVTTNLCLSSNSRTKRRLCVRACNSGSDNPAAWAFSES
jgi:hypothetical protein